MAFNPLISLQEFVKRSGVRGITKKEAQREYLTFFDNNSGGGGGTVTGGNNTGGGGSIFSGILANIMQFRSLVAGNKILITQNPNDLTIDALFNENTIPPIQSSDYSNFPAPNTPFFTLPSQVSKITKYTVGNSTIPDWGQNKFPDLDSCINQILADNGGLAGMETLTQPIIVFIEPGNYVLGVDIPPNITFFGLGSNQSVIEGEGIGYVQNIVISGEVNYVRTNIVSHVKNSWNNISFTDDSHKLIGNGNWNITYNDCDIHSINNPGFLITPADNVTVRVYLNNTRVIAYNIGSVALFLDTLVYLNNSYIGNLGNLGIVFNGSNSSFISKDSIINVGFYGDPISTSVFVNTIFTRTTPTADFIMIDGFGIFIDTYIQKPSIAPYAVDGLGSILFENFRAVDGNYDIIGFNPTLFVQGVGQENKYTTKITGDGVTTSWQINHQLGRVTRATVYDDTETEISVGVQRTGAIKNQSTLTIIPAIPNGVNYTVLIS